jgi:hypothetical protein
MGGYQLRSRGTRSSARRRLARKVRIAGSLVLAGLLLLPGAASAQDVDMADIKAAFVYNFAKFTDWPADAIAPSAPLTLCILDSPPGSTPLAARVASALTALVRGRKVGTHSLTVATFTALGGSLRSCHLLYAPDLDESRARELLAFVGRWPVLTISDDEGFAELGGIANFTLEDRRLRFVINVAASQRARLQLSSQLISLGRLTQGTYAGH